MLIIESMSICNCLYAIKCNSSNNKNISVLKFSFREVVWNLPLLLLLLLSLFFFFIVQSSTFVSWPIQFYLCKTYRIFHCTFSLYLSFYFIFYLSSGPPSALLSFLSLWPFLYCSILLPLHRAHNWTAQN